MACMARLLLCAGLCMPPPRRRLEVGGAGSPCFCFWGSGSGLAGSNTQPWSGQQINTLPEVASIIISCPLSLSPHLQNLGGEEQCCFWVILRTPCHPSTPWTGHSLWAMPCAGHEFHMMFDLRNGLMGTMISLMEKLSGTP